MKHRLVFISIPILVLLFSGGAVAFEVEAGGTYEDLDGSYSDWRSYHVNFSAKPAPRRSIYGSFLVTERFSLKDEEFAMGFYAPLGDEWGSRLEYTLSPSRNVLPEFSVASGIEYALKKGIIAHLGIKATSYPESSVLLGSASLEGYFGNLRGVYTFYSSYLVDAASEEAHRFQVNYYYGDGSTIGLGYAFGKEAEKTGPDRVLISEITTVSLPGVHRLNPRWAAAYELSMHRQGESYTRKGIRLGVKRLF